MRADTNFKGSDSGYPSGLIVILCLGNVVYIIATYFATLDLTFLITIILFTEASNKTKATLYNSHSLLQVIVQAYSYLCSILCFCKLEQ